MEHQNDVSLDANFPGGNIILEKIEGDEVFLRQDLRDTAGDWFYWAFRVRGAAGRRLTFRFTGSDVVGVRGPALSRDGGSTWQWLEEHSVSRATAGGPAFSCEFAPDDAEVFFALCPLYTEVHLREFLSRHATNPELHVETLCHSRQGRAVELLRIQGQSPAHRVLFTCRHHACEAMASFVLEGVLEAALDGNDIGAWLRTHVALAAVPFMDKDGVEAGDQGKNRRPYDHNRDYGSTPDDSIYPEVRALRTWAPEWLAQSQSGEEHMHLAFDLHCPWIRGSHNEDLYFVGGPDTSIWERVMRFSHVLSTVRNGPLPFEVSHNLPFGQGWNTLEGAAVGSRSCSNWTSSLPGIHFGTTLEVPYANAGGAVVTPQSARALGHDLADALRSYLCSLRLLGESS